MRPVAALLAAAVLAALAACGGDGEAEPAPPPPPAAATGPESDQELFPRGTVTIETGAAEVVVPVEIASTDAQRQLGLMYRESLPEDEGMVFLFEEDSTSGFWMKNTLVPLSIAFADADGAIVSILDMEPCRADPCPVYDPGAAYRTALEVNQGAFERWGVAEGDRLRISQ